MCPCITSDTISSSITGIVIQIRNMMNYWIAISSTSIEISISLTVAINTTQWWWVYCLLIKMVILVYRCIGLECVLCIAELWQCRILFCQFLFVLSRTIMLHLLLLLVLLLLLKFLICLYIIWEVRLFNMLLCSTAGQSRCQYELS